MRLMIAVPCLDQSRSEFTESVVNLVTKLARDGVDFVYRQVKGTLTYQAREELARAAIEGGFDYMLWLDSDMEIPANAYNLLMDGMMKTNAAFVTGIYRCRRKPFQKLVYRLISPFQAQYCGESLPGELFPVEGCGLGCVLVSVQALKTVWKRFGTAFTPTEGLGEDLAFCLRLKQCGFKAYAEPNVKCSHIGSISISCDDVDRLMDYFKRR